MEQQYNFLYYYPNEGNKLCRCERKSREFKKIRSELSSKLIGLILVNGALCPNGSVAYKMHKQYKKVIYSCISFTLLLFLYLAIITVLNLFGAISAKYSTLEDDFIGDGIVFISLIILSLISSNVMMIYVFKMRNKLLDYYLSCYKPICEQFSDELLREVAFHFSYTFDNMEYFTEGEFNNEIADDILDEQNEDFEDEQNDKCICINCMRDLNKAKISEFDEHNSAKCPYCGNPSIVPFVANTDDEFINHMHLYWVSL